MGTIRESMLRKLARLGWELDGAELVQEGYVVKRSRRAQTYDSWWTPIAVGSSAGVGTGTFLMFLR